MAKQISQFRESVIRVALIMSKLIKALVIVGTILIISGLIILAYHFIAPFVYDNDYPRIHIKPDGTIEPSSTPISREGNLYTLESDITLYKLFIEKSDITFDGNGFSIRITSPNGSKGGPGLGSIELTNVENVILRNVITGFARETSDNVYGSHFAADLIFVNASFCEAVDSNVHSIFINHCHNIIVSENDISTTCRNGGNIQLTNSTGCTISSCSTSAVGRCAICWIATPNCPSIRCWLSGSNWRTP